MTDTSEQRFEPLTMIEGQPRTPSGEFGCVMRYAGRAQEDMQVFQYRPSFFSDIYGIAWPLDTMKAVIPADMAGYLLNNGYARLMTETEMDAYNAIFNVEKESKS